MELRSFKPIKLKGSVVMGCCGGSNNQSDNRNKPMKEWGTEKNNDHAGLKQNPLLIIAAVLLIVLIVYKFVI